MPALSRMVSISGGDHSNSESADESRTMDVLVDENRFVIANSFPPRMNYQ